jgi:hypothetical protein
MLGAVKPHLPETLRCQFARLSHSESRLLPEMALLAAPNGDHSAPLLAKCAVKRRLEPRSMLAAEAHPRRLFVFYYGVQSLEYVESLQALVMADSQLRLCGDSACIGM